MNFFKRNTLTLTMIIAAFGIALALSYYFASQSLTRTRKEAEHRLDMQADLIVTRALEEYNSAVTMLRGIQGFFVGSEKVTNLEFSNFIESSNFFERHPQFSSIAYIDVVQDADKEKLIEKIRSDTSINKELYSSFTINPEGTREEYWPITHIFPETEKNILLGDDQKVEKLHAENISYSRDIGGDSLSSALKLKQGLIGAIITVPVYKTPKTPPSIEERRQLFKGSVIALFSVEEFFKPILKIDELREKAVNISTFGRYGVTTPIFVAEIPNDFITYFFGIVEITKEIQIGHDNLQFIFKAPLRNQITHMELLEPVFLTLIFLAAALCMSVIVVVSQKAKLIRDLKKRYEFISALSHQLRTPITRLRFQLETCDMPKTKERNLMMKDITSLNTIMDRLLLYIETVDKNIVTNKEAVNIENLYNSILDIISKTHDSSRIERKDKKTIEKKIFADKEKIIQALSYIVENALTYSPKDKPIGIKIVEHNGMADIIISDKGYGIPEKEQGKVFSEFFRASNAALGINYGSGVSLFMAKNIIEKNGGTIKFTSKENKGSVFTISLPLEK